MSRCFTSGYLAQRQTQRNHAAIVLGLAFTLSSAIVGLGFLVPERSAPSAPKPDRNAELAIPVETVDVLVPRADIEPNEPLEARLFEMRPWPKAAVLAKTVRDLENIKGQFARSFIAAGQPLHAGYIAAHRSASPISPLIPKGFLAVTIRVNDISSVDGFVRPGEVVDVAWLHTLKGKPAIKVIVQNVKVMAADQHTDANWRPGMAVPGTITLQGTAKDAQYILLAQGSGTLNLALRNPEDYSDHQNTSPITTDQLTNDQPGPAPDRKCLNRIRVCDPAKSCQWVCLDAQDLPERAGGSV